MSLNDKVDEEYDARFNDVAKEWLRKYAVSPEVANKYDKKFSGGDIAKLVQSGILPEQAAPYDERFSGWDIASLVKAKCPPQQADKYNKRFNGWDIANLFEANCSSEQAKLYDKRFNSVDISNLFKEKCSPKTANAYDPRFHAIDISIFAKSDILPETAIKYDERFNALDIRFLAKFGVSNDVAIQYDKRFIGSEIVILVKEKCSAKIANEYDKRFDGADIAQLLNAKCSPEQSARYSKRFNADEIAQLFKANVSPKEAELYDERFNGLEIELLYTSGIMHDKTDEVDKIKAILDRILDYKENISNSPNFELMATSANSVLLLKDNSVLKFSRDIKYETELLKKLKGAKNIIHIKAEPKDNSTLEFEYIKGTTLDNLIKEHGKLPYEKILKYSAGIMNGLVEMRQAGIFYHRDIRPANIMIDEENDDAVIIDLGIATTDKYAKSRYNKRYGGPNDLTSLGQVMYYLATGTHLFNMSLSMSKTFGSVAEQIDDYRTQVYADPALLEEHLKIVDSEINDTRIADLIKACLTAKNHHYNKIQRMFLRYLK